MSSRKTFDATRTALRLPRFGAAVIAAITFLSFAGCLDSNAPGAGIPNSESSRYVVTTAAGSSYEFAIQHEFTSDSILVTVTGLESTEFLLDRRDGQIISVTNSGGTRFVFDAPSLRPFPKGLLDDSPLRSAEFLPIGFLSAPLVSKGTFASGFNQEITWKSGELDFALRGPCMVDCRGYGGQELAITGQHESDSLHPPRLEFSLEGEVLATATKSASINMSSELATWNWDHLSTPRHGRSEIRPDADWCPPIPCEYDSSSYPLSYERALSALEENPDWSAWADGNAIWPVELEVTTQPSNLPVLGDQLVTWKMLFYRELDGSTMWVDAEQEWNPSLALPVDVTAVYSGDSIAGDWVGASQAMARHNHLGVVMNRIQDEYQVGSISSATFIRHPAWDTPSMYLGTMYEFDTSKGRLQTLGITGELVTSSIS